MTVGATMGIVLVSIIAPNAIQLLNKASWVKKTYKNYLGKDNDQKQKIIQSFYYLKRSGLITLTPKNENYVMEITDKGQRKIVEMNLRTLRIESPSKKWDGTWWMAIADIPTELRSQANLLRNKFKDLNIFTLQRSVWVYPFNPKKEIAFISALYGLERYITIFKATELEKEDEIKLRSYYRFLLKKYI